jgi:hypothetical protein
MLASFRRSWGHRWPRGQRFGLSPLGLASIATYRQAVASVRQLGREALEAADRAWAVPRLLVPGDGVVLCEVQPGRRNLNDLSRALEPCGVTAAEVKAAVDRLADAGLVEPAPPARPSLA